VVLRPRGDVYDPEQDARVKTSRMLEAWRRNPDETAWQQLSKGSRNLVEPVLFEPSPTIQSECPAYRGVIRDYHRCAANDIPPWETFEDYPQDEPGVATCEHCNWKN